VGRGAKPKTFGGNGAFFSTRIANAGEQCLNRVVVAMVGPKRAQLPADGIPLRKEGPPALFVVTGPGPTMGECPYGMASIWFVGDFGKDDLFPAPRGCKLARPSKLLGLTQRKSRILGRARLIRRQEGVHPLNHEG